MASTSGSVSLIAPPSDVRIDALQSDTSVRVFSEVQGLTLSAPLTVDFNAPGSYTAEPAPPLPVIAAGTSVNSYYLVADPLVPPAVGTLYSGSITFDRNVLGIIALNNEFASSNSIVGHAGTQYSIAVQFEFAGQEDRFTLSADRRTITFNIVTFNAADNLRIITDR